MCKLKSKWLKDLNIKIETFTLLEDKIVQILEDISIDKDPLDKNLIKYEII